MKRSFTKISIQTANSLFNFPILWEIIPKKRVEVEKWQKNRLNWSILQVKCLLK